MWNMVVLIPKGEVRDFRGVGIVEVIRKTITGLLKRLLTSMIGFHDILHGINQLIMCTPYIRSLLWDDSETYSCDTVGGIVF